MLVKSWGRRLRTRQLVVSWLPCCGSKETYSTRSVCVLCVCLFEYFLPLITIYAQSGNYPSATLAYSSAIKLHPEETIYRLNRAASLLMEQDFLAALQDCQSVLAADPDNTKALIRAVRALRELGRFEEARLQLSHAALATGSMESEARTERAVLIAVETALQRSRVWKAQQRYDEALNALVLSCDRVSAALNSELIQLEHVDLLAWSVSQGVRDRYQGNFCLYIHSTPLHSTIVGTHAFSVFAIKKGRARIPLSGGHASLPSAAGAHTANFGCQPPENGATGGDGVSISILRVADYQPATDHRQAVRMVRPSFLSYAS